MSSSDASVDGSGDAISNISPNNQTIPLHQPPLILDSTQKHTHISPPASEADLFQNIPFVYPDDDKDLIVPMEQGGLEAEEEGKEEGEEIPEEVTASLAQIYRTRNREPPPGAIRVHKIVRVRKFQSSSKRRSKKHALRVQLKEKDRIEEEMAQYRGMGGGKAKEKPIPERRYHSVDAGSRGPSNLRFSESCIYDEGLEDKEPSTFPENPELSTECQLAPPPLDPGAQPLDWNTKAQPPQFT